MNKYEEELEKIVADGYVFKSADVAVQEVTDDDLKKINKYAIVPLEAEDVFVFKTMIGDNELDDRNFEPFNLNALKDLEKLYKGKPVLKDHRRMADNQVARVYDTELVINDAKQTGAGEPHAELIARSYMLKTGSNADLIADIKGGIKKEVSTGCLAKHAYCSICGADNKQTYCPHWWGQEYDKEGGKQTCYFTLDGAKDAYELSFVAVPAQPRAGTRKNYGGTELPAKEQTDSKETAETNTETEALTLSIENVGAFLFAKKNKLTLEENVNE